MQNKQTNAREAHRPAPSSPSKVTTMLKGMKKHDAKEQGKTLKHESSRSTQSHTEQEQHRDHRPRTASSINYRGLKHF